MHLLCNCRSVAAPGIGCERCSYLVHILLSMPAACRGCLSWPNIFKAALLAWERLKPTGVWAGGVHTSKVMFAVQGFWAGSWGN